MGIFRADRIRRWGRIGLSGVLGVAMHGAAAQTSPAPAKPAAGSSKPTAKPRPQTAARKSASHVTPHASSHTAAHATSRPSSHSAKGAASRTASHKSSRTGGKGRSRKTAAKRGQQSIDSARAREIQQALIRQNYLQGEPSGAWDNATQDAMKRYQADHGWQSKTVPDSRALIRLGLGPNSDHLLNPESAMTSEPAASDPKTDSKQTPQEDDHPQR